MYALTKYDDLSAILGRRGLSPQASVRQIGSLSELSQVYRLTHASYVEHEYVAPHPSEMLIHYPYFDHLPETRVLVAEFEGQVVGTVSYTLDGPSGLTVDEDFKTQCDEERASGKSVAAVWRLVVDEKQRQHREIVTSLIREVIIGLRENLVQSCFFSVNPKHVSVYKKLLNMEVVSQKEVTKGLRNAPSVLLRGDPYRIPSRIVSSEESYEMPIFIPVLLNVHAF